MVFSFNFSLSVPGIANPFTAAAEAAAIADPAPPQSDLHFDNSVQHSTISRRRPPSPSPSLLPPLSRKRGWVPSNSELSLAAPMRTSTSGYLDTPAKYREMAYNSADQDEIEELVADLPPPKRRRTLAGSIISTALSAALIGTAVGLTVYRLWRDRGRNPEALPPPPYEQGEWVPPEPETPPLPATPALKSASTPRSRKSRLVASRRTVPRHRKTPSRAGASAHYYGSLTTVASSSRSPIPPEFNFACGSRSSPKPTEDAEVDEQMSWIGDRLAHLIEEGQKALGKEIVIMSEDKADEVDDGSGAWIEEDDSHATPDVSHHSSFGLPPYSPGSPSFGYTSSPSRRRLNRDVSVESETRSVASSFHEDESVWTSAEMRESMERARMLYRQKRGL